MTTTKTKTFWITGALLVAMGASGAAMAHERGGKGRDGAGPRGMFLQEMFAEADANGDGKITEEEMAAAAAQRFSDADTDGDGNLSAEELTAQAQARKAAREAARREARSAAMIERLDTDGDGLLSQEEMSARRPADRFAKMLERLDADKDGALSIEEMKQARMMRHGGKHDKRGGDDMRRGDHGARDGQEQPEQTD
ncbi:EF-hand domain-containing protein [Sagittula sp. NFXS13]|uniref:EF-hand domain-containing protein n=1 Tax=Sagittula sp. NFXS13 TaxID=2819095 RepID=UPI0032DFD8E5